MSAERKQRRIRRQIRTADFIDQSGIFRQFLFAGLPFTDFIELSVFADQPGNSSSVTAVFLCDFICGHSGVMKQAECTSVRFSQPGKIPEGCIHFCGTAVSCFFHDFMVAEKTEHEKNKVFTKSETWLSCMINVTA